MSLALNPQDDAVRPPTTSDGVWSNAWLDWFTLGLYWGVHVAALGVFWTGVTPTAVALLAATFWLRMFGITAGYHRYFAHKTYRTEVYTGAAHGYTMADTAAYDEAAAERHYNALFDLLGRTVAA